LHAHFPHYDYKDQVRAQHLLLVKIGIKHLKLVLGTSMGGMQTWLWGEMFPNDMDCLVAIASTPAAISGRNMIWREMVSQAIRGDPAWKNGDYPKDSPPKNWINAVIPLSAIMTGSAEELQMQGPTRATAIDLVKNLEASGEAYDANDVLYDFEGPPGITTSGVVRCRGFAVPSSILLHALSIRQLLRRNARLQTASG
jgi:homoserine O-acetyltransferase/O-succinyltransferase